MTRLRLKATDGQEGDTICLLVIVETNAFVPVAAPKVRNVLADQIAYANVVAARNNRLQKARESGLFDM
jgi:hypothetical protein